MQEKTEESLSTTEPGANGALRAAKEIAEVEKAKPKKTKKSKPATPFKVGESGFLTKSQRERVVLVTDETDMLYNPKVKDPPPEKLHEAMAAQGWLETNPLAILPDGRIWSGRTKWRVLPKAEKLRGDEINVPYRVVEIDELTASDATDMLDLQVQKLNPMLVAEKIVRAYSRGKTEKEIFELTGIKSEDQHGYLLLVEKLPEELQNLVREGSLPFAAAIALARSAEKLTESEMRAAAEQVAKMANGGVRVTTEQVKRAAGAGASEGPATKKQVKQFLLDLQSDKLTGKHGEQVTMALIIGIEIGLGTRTLSSAKSAGRKLAHGEDVRVDFKQYQDGSKAPKEPVKGQAKPKKK